MYIYQRLGDNKMAKLKDLLKEDKDTNQNNNKINKYQFKY